MVPDGACPGWFPEQIVLEEASPRPIREVSNLPPKIPSQYRTSNHRVSLPAVADLSGKRRITLPHLPVNLIWRNPCLEFSPKQALESLAQDSNGLEVQEIFDDQKAVLSKLIDLVLGEQAHYTPSWSIPISKQPVSVREWWQVPGG